jgi:hypothetical protein
VNTLEIIQQDIPGVCRKGDILLCVRELNLVAILNLQERKIVWEWGPGELSLPHRPSFLDNGNLLIFDNGVSRERSRVVELDPVQKRIVWEYRASPPEKFFTSERGGCQRLPNGNTLITESNKGHVFEVTPDKEVVWEFYNPERQTEKKTRAAIYWMSRLTDDDILVWVAERTRHRQSKSQ